MLNASINIHKDDLDNTDFSKTRLYIDAGSSHFAFAVLDISTNVFIAYEFFQLKSSNHEEDLSWVLKNNQLLAQSFKDVFVAFNTKEAVLIPQEFYKQEDGETILSMIHGDHKTGQVLQEHIPGYEINAIYQVPEFLHSELSARFLNGHYWHFYATLLQIFKQRQNELPGSFLYINFYPNQIVVAVVQNEVCQLIQTFLYDIPEDVSYFLLNITEQLEIDNTLIPVLISGLIDTDSALHAELLKYFINVETESGLNKFTADPLFDTVPAHFFTPVFSLALCE